MDPELQGRFERLLRDRVFYQDLFGNAFRLGALDESMRTLGVDAKLQIMGAAMDLIFKTDKLRHAAPPLKLQQFKKANAKPYSFKEKQFQVADRRSTCVDRFRRGRGLVCVEAAAGDRAAEEGHHDKREHKETEDQLETATRQKSKHNRAE